MPVKPDITKNMIRAEIDAQINAYLQEGGEVAAIDNGTSGRDNPDQALPPQAFNQPRAKRTPVGDSISNIEARKKPQTNNKAPSNKPAKKEMLLDDFGEPLRWQWKQTD